jgi:hypothetical protein
MTLPTINDLSELSTDDLRAKLARALEATAAGLYQAAEIWSELNRRGEAIPRLPGILQWLPRVARGELAAETIIAFAGQGSLIGAMIGMSLDEQRKYADGELITVATFDEDGKAISQAKPLTELTAREVKLVVDRGQIRTIKAQINSLNRSRTQTKTKPPVSTVTIHADIGAGLLVVGHSRISPTELATHLWRLGWRLERLGEERNRTYAETRPQA